MPKLPSVSGADVIRLLETLGYELVRQRGSHARLRVATPAGEHNITVPMHKSIAKGTLNDILSTVALRTGVSKDDLVGRLTRR